MRRSLANQSALLLVVTAALSQLGFLFLGFGPGEPFIVVASIAALVVFGLPHGAFDINIIKIVFGRGWLLAAAAYIGLAGLGAGLYQLSAELFFLAFLALSVLHFGDSDWPGEATAVKLLWGAAVITLPSLFYPPLVADLFSTLAGAPLASSATSVLKLACIPLLLTLLLAARKTNTILVAAAALSFLYYLAGPILGFALYMSLFHARTHLNHWEKLLASGSDTSLASVLAISTGLVICVFVIMNVESLGITASVTRISFVALACLTVPHMILVYFAGKSSTLNSSEK